MTTLRGLNVVNATNSGTLTTQVGVDIADLTSGGTDIGLRIAGADTYAIQVGSGADNTDAANGITFGSSADTNLYRGAANQLKTDDSFVSSANDLGWVIVDQTDNQACTTGCTSACVVGQDLAGANKPLVSCSSTIADICLCAGSS